MNWSKSYIYAGSRLLSTITKNGASETTEYHHPDRLGTKLVTTSGTSLNTAKSQATLPFGTEITAETQANTNQKFTSYDRSGATGLDYAVNRTYNSGQSRFTQVDPIGMDATNIGDPQSLNMFAYTKNNPVDFVDPNGLEFGYGDSFWCWFSTVESDVPWLTAQACRPSERTKATGKGGGGVSTLGFEGRRKKKINSVLDGLEDNEECEKAFRKAGVKPIKDQIKSGVKFVGYHIAALPNGDKSWAPSKKFADGVRATYRDNKGQIADIAYPGSGVIVLTEIGKADQMTM